MSNFKTEAQLVVNVLLRGVVPSSHTSGEIELAGLRLTIVGAADASQWQASEVADGDLHAVVWTTPRELITVVRRLTACEEVVDAHSAGSATPAD